jgi:hypothetical protein
MQMRGIHGNVLAAGPETRAKKALACVRFIGHTAGTLAMQNVYHSELAVMPGSPSEANEELEP